MKHRWIRMAVRVVLFLIIAIAGFGQAVHYLWNWLMPGLFGLRSISFGQSLGLLGLSWLLFGGWRGFHGPRRGGHWRARMAQRWEGMTPEERASFLGGARHRCGRMGRPAGMEATKQQA